MNEGDTMDNDLISRSKAIEAMLKQKMPTPSVIRRVLMQVPGVDASDTIERLEAENKRLKRAIREVEQLRKERDEAVADAVYSNNLLKLIHHLMKERRVIQED